jgi:hypothetical protein
MLKLWELEQVFYGRMKKLGAHYVNQLSSFAAAADTDRSGVPLLQVVMVVMSAGPQDADPFDDYGKHLTVAVVLVEEDKEWKLVAPLAIVIMYCKVDMKN